MQSRDSIRIIARFFVALQLLKESGVIRGKKTFTDRYGINRWNLNSCEKDPGRDLFQLSWLTYLVRDYNVSPRWLITGDGDFWSKKELVNELRKEQKTANKLQTENSILIKD
nr:hypothetical protein [uncultured Prevotella sp.]